VITKDLNGGSGDPIHVDMGREKHRRALKNTRIKRKLLCGRIAFVVCGLGTRPLPVPVIEWELKYG